MVKLKSSGVVSLGNSLLLSKLTPLLLLFLLSLTSVSAYGFNRTEVPEDGYRIWKFGHNRRYDLSCASDSMYPTLNCTKTYWAYSAGFTHDWNVNARVGDIIGFRVPKLWRNEYYHNYGVRIKYFVHRIVRKEGDCWITAGDNNDVEDAMCVTDSMIQYVILWEEPNPNNRDIEAR